MVEEARSTHEGGCRTFSSKKGPIEQCGGFLADAKARLAGRQASRQPLTPGRGPRASLVPPHTCTMAAAHRRLGRIVAIHARYATQDRDTACVVVLRRKNEPPFFVTSPQTGPSGVWGEYTSVPIHPEEAFAPWLCQEGGLDTRRVLVSLWQETMPPHSDEGASRAWSCVWERTLDLRRATSVDAETFSSDGAEPRVYLAVRTDEDRYEYLPVSTPLSEATPISDSDAGRRSYTWAELQSYVRLILTHSLVHLQAELHSATCERVRLLDRCAPALQDSEGLVRKRTKLEWRQDLQGLRAQQRDRMRAIASCTYRATDLQYETPCMHGTKRYDNGNSAWTRHKRFFSGCAMRTIKDNNTHATSVRHIPTFSSAWRSDELSFFVSWKLSTLSSWWMRAICCTPL